MKSGALALRLPGPALPFIVAMAMTCPARAADVGDKDNGKDGGKVSPPTFCTEQYAPVCARLNGERKTYSNACFARAGGATVIADGPCADTGSAKPAGDAAPSSGSGDGANLNAFSVREGTQLNVGKLGIGVGYVGTGPYLDEKNVRRDGLHASLSIAVEGLPALFQQPDVHEGDTVAVAGYSISIVKLIPGPRGSVVMRVEKAKK